MKLTIKTENIELEYQDGYSKLEHEVKERIKDIIKLMYECDALSRPTTIISTPITGTVN